MQRNAKTVRHLTFCTIPCSFRVWNSFSCVQLIHFKEKKAKKSEKNERQFGPLCGRENSRSEIVGR